MKKRWKSIDQLLLLLLFRIVPHRRFSWCLWTEIEQKKLKEKKIRKTVTNRNLICCDILQTVDFDFCLVLHVCFVLFVALHFGNATKNRQVSKNRYCYYTQIDFPYRITKRKPSFSFIFMRRQRKNSENSRRFWV